ncbi:radical SAM protein [Stenotrophomonas sp. Sm3212]|jgi:uncharacterized protein|uniref:Radical SAM protein n=1 Tax=Stenotrophomonas pavanii TaxID=487698 RepID=A0A2D0ANL9_9GAMM|nr:MULTISPECIES: radical SAM protein [Stenotrophomonas]MBC9080110.1 radical SAM protein [Stenotrophomonas maltophilia]MBC9094095.1 radical SAM protein [Stenotrophomonas maltophilia]MBH1387485.1 radical SAM protein [Stenotrophomonas maltophilia]MBH1522830.1 radical SAM protein [Stenotrophomonas maltophilia]MBN4942860.1 radical SAM protein [Stenotrophomonas maltophilia]
MINGLNTPLVTTIQKLQELQVIIKIAERCNLACSYCYYFFMGDESYKDRDPIMKQDKFGEIAEYLREGVIDLGIRNVNVVFHGGEPTLMRPRDFRLLAENLREALAPNCRLSFGIQTNGYHLNREWEEIFSDFNISVGISLDGPAEYNDRFRVTHKGKGSHAKIVQTIERLHELEREEKINNIGVLSVLGRDLPVQKTFDHFVSDLQFSYIGFLLPDRSHDEPFVEGDSAEAYGDQLIELFQEWLRHQHVSVREVTKVLRYFQSFAESNARAADVFDKGTHVVVIQSTGEVNCDDSLIPALDWRNSQRRYSVFNSRLRDFVNDPGLVSLDLARSKLPEGCKQCEWVKICGGGALENRFSKARQFDNSSVYCAGLKKYFSHICDCLVSNGYPRDVLDEKLKIEGAYQPTFAI